MRRLFYTQISAMLVLSDNELLGLRLFHTTVTKFKRWLFCGVSETGTVLHSIYWIITGSDRRPETKQGIEGKIVRFRSEGLGIGLGLGIRIADLKLSISPIWS